MQVTFRPLPITEESEEILKDKDAMWLNLLKNNSVVDMFFFRMTNSVNKAVLAVWLKLYIMTMVEKNNALGQVHNLKVYYTVYYGVLWVNL